MLNYESITSLLHVPLSIFKHKALSEILIILLLGKVTGSPAAAETMYRVVQKSVGWVS